MDIKYINLRQTEKSVTNNRYLVLFLYFTGPIKVTFSTCQYAIISVNPLFMSSQNFSSYPKELIIA